MVRQFSLASLMAAVAIVGVTLGMVRWSLNAGISPWTVAGAFAIFIGIVAVAVAKSETL